MVFQPDCVACPNPKCLLNIYTSTLCRVARDYFLIIFLKGLVTSKV